jgi:hypothetical protein
MTSLNISCGWKDEKSRQEPRRWTLGMGCMLVLAAALVLWRAPVEAQFPRCSEECGQTVACSTACTYSDGVATTCGAAGYNCTNGDEGSGGSGGSGGGGGNCQGSDCGRLPYYDFCPPDSQRTCIPTAGYWTGWASEETGSLYCEPNTGVGGFACRGRYCDDVNLFCAYGRSLDPHSPSTYWTDYFSEEGQNVRYCFEGAGIVTGIDCSGRYCDNISLECTRGGPEPIPSNCEWWAGGAKLSEEQGYGYFNRKFLTGVKCTGRYCDNLQFYICW